MKDNILICEISSISDGPTKNLAKIKANPFLWQFKFSESWQLIFASEAQLIFCPANIFIQQKKPNIPTQKKKKRKLPLCPGQYENLLDTNCDNLLALSFFFYIINFNALPVSQKKKKNFNALPYFLINFPKIFCYKCSSLFLFN